MLYEIRLYLLAMFGRIVWRHFIYMYVWPVVLMLAVVNEGSDIVRGGQNDTTVIVIICVAAVCCTVLWGKARPHWGRPHVRGVIVCVGDVLSNWENCWYCDDWSWSDFDDDESLVHNYCECAIMAGAWTKCDLSSFVIKEIKATCPKLPHCSQMTRLTFV